MNKEEKQQTVDALAGEFRSVASVFLLDYKGLKVVDATELRRKIRDSGGRYLVVKNTLALRAARETKLEVLKDYFEGPTALAYHPRDVVGLAKLLTEVTKANPNVKFKAALVEGKLVSTAEIPSIASMPAKEVLLGKVLFLLKAPVSRLAMTLKAPVRDLVLVLRQVKK